MKPRKPDTGIQPASKGYTLTPSTIALEKALNIWHSPDDHPTIAKSYHVSQDMVQMIKSLTLHSQRQHDTGNH